MDGVSRELFEPSCYISAVLPSPESRFIRPAILSALLVLGSGLLTLIPARHGVLELWPARVDELVLPDGSLRFRAGSVLAAPAQPVLTASQPLSLLALELHGGDLVYGYLLSAPTETPMLLDTGTDERLSIASDRVRRAYHPNAVSLPGRVRLMLSRLADRRPVLAARLPASALDEGFPALSSGESDDLAD